MIDAIRSEWIKVSTLTVTWVLALLAVLFPIVVTVLTAMFAKDKAPSDLVDVSAGTTVVAAMLLGVIASIGITNEFSHGTIRTTFAAMPDRWRPLLAKPVVQVVIAVILTTVIVVLSYVVGGAIAADPTSLEDGAGAALVGVVLLAIGLTLLGYGLGLLLRNSAAAICLLLLWPLIAEGLIAGLLTVAGVEGAVRLLPYAAGINMAVVDPDPDSFGRIGGGVYFFVWVIAITVLGLLRTRRRDA
ncbi:MAG: ABC transporter permease [Ilumatobacteraceae bacterium]